MLDPVDHVMTHDMAVSPPVMNVLVDVPVREIDVGVDIPLLECLITDEVEVEKILKGLNIHKSSGSDLVGNMILKQCCGSMSLPLSVLFNTSFDNAYFPAAWKKVDVFPVLKKDNPQVISNYGYG